LQTAFNLPNVYDFTRVAELCRQQADEQNHENNRVRSIGQGEARHRKYKKGGGQVYDRSSD
jgi:hypothetical protein